MDVYKFTYLGAVLLLFSLEGYESCTCGRRPMQQEFCTTDFVLLAVVDSVALTENGTEWSPQPNSWNGVKFRLRDVRVLRSNENYESTEDKEHIHTAAYGALCGAYLRNQTEYVIFGHASNGMLRTSSCTRTKPWHWVIKKYRDDYINNLPGYCAECKIHTCIGSRAHASCQEKPENADPKTCLMRDRKCALRAYCRKSAQSGSCAWYHVMDGEPMRCDHVEPETDEPEVTLPPVPTIPEPKKAESEVEQNEVNETKPDVDEAEVNITSVPEVETTTEKIEWFGAELPLPGGDLAEEDTPVSLPDPEDVLPNSTETEIVDSKEPEVVDSTEPEVVDSTEPEVVDSAEPEVVDSTEPEVVDSTEPEVVDSTKPVTDVEKPEEIAEEATEIDDSHVDPNLINPGV